MSAIGVDFSFFRPEDDRSIAGDEDTQTSARRAEIKHSCNNLCAASDRQSTRMDRLVPLDPVEARRGRIALSALFLLNGAILGSWAGVARSGKK